MHWFIMRQSSTRFICLFRKYNFRRWWFNVWVVFALFLNCWGLLLKIFLNNVLIHGLCIFELMLLMFILLRIGNLAILNCIVCQINIGFCWIFFYSLEIIGSILKMLVCLQFFWRFCAFNCYCLCHLNLPIWCFSWFLCLNIYVKDSIWGILIFLKILI